MDKDTALDLALEALEESHPEAYRHVITAIKQARSAQQEHEPENEPHVSLASVREDWGPGPHEVHSLPAQVQEQTDWEAIAADQAMTIALLKSEAAAKRPWVGLTDEEIEAADYITMTREDYEVFLINQDSVKDFARTIETKLKEKNT